MREWREAQRMEGLQLCECLEGVLNIESGCEGEQREIGSSAWLDGGDMDVELVR